MKKWIKLIPTLLSVFWILSNLFQWVKNWIKVKLIAKLWTNYIYDFNIIQEPQSKNIIQEQLTYKFKKLNQCNLDLKFSMFEYLIQLLQDWTFFFDLFADCVHFFFINLLKCPKTIYINFNGKTVPWRLNWKFRKKRQVINSKYCLRYVSSIIEINVGEFWNINKITKVWKIASHFVFLS